MNKLASANHDLLFFDLKHSKYNHTNLYPMSPDPDEWRDRDIEWIIRSLSKVVSRRPIIGVDFACVLHRTMADPDRLRFRVKYDLHKPSVKHIVNVEILRNNLIMECL